ncbi:hypothetical protein SB5439_05145 [Klebsiella variicola]|uniref:hypothetical protein n=1 Tax=Klebsiella variicola TaxID=244366 RepID=UPI00109CC4F5|nr:hypothetical protein [Klebsiella variicola]VGQ13109.1 hypothetical protein SB5439_05145 [Klebsiella variicola]
MANNTQLRCSKCGGQTVRAELRVAKGFECYCACGHVYVSNSIAAGVSFQRFQVGSTESGMQIEGKAEGDGATFTKKDYRDQAADCLREAEKALQALIDCYGEGESYSAAHPKAGYRNMLERIAQTRKAIARSRV